MPEFDAPEDEDPISLRGDHVVRFKVLLPDFQPDGDSEKDKLIRRILEVEAKNKAKYYGHYSNVRRPPINRNKEPKKSAKPA